MCIAIPRQIDSTHLQPCLHPIKLSALEELCCLKGTQQVLLFDILWWPVVQLIQHIILQEFLITHTDLQRNNNNIGYTLRSMKLTM